MIGGPFFSGSTTHADLPSLSLSRRGFVGALILTAGALAFGKPDKALAWSSWEFFASEATKALGIGDPMHEDMVQMAYARVVSHHKLEDATYKSLLNPWNYGDTSNVPADAKTYSGEPLDHRSVYRENLGYLRIGSYWNDAAANVASDFAYSALGSGPEDIRPYANANKPNYASAADVADHVKANWEYTKKTHYAKYDTLVQFTMNERMNFLHAMLTMNADKSKALTQKQIRDFMVQWIGVAYEFARTGVKPTSGEAGRIWSFIDTYGQLDTGGKVIDDSLKIGVTAASRDITLRQMRLRALGMICHTLEDSWCPSHCCRTYNDELGGTIRKYTILAFENYVQQSAGLLDSFHSPFDKYSEADSKAENGDMRVALTQGGSGYAGTKDIDNAISLTATNYDDFFAAFKTLGMKEALACLTQLFEYIYTNTPWEADGGTGVRDWIEDEVLPTHFDDDGASYICMAGRRSLHTPTFVIAPLDTMKDVFDTYLGAEVYEQINAKLYSYLHFYQNAAISFFSGKDNDGSQHLPGTKENDEGCQPLKEIIDSFYNEISALATKTQGLMRTKLGPKGCPTFASIIANLRGLLQEFAVELTGDLLGEDDEHVRKANWLIDWASAKKTWTYAVESRVDIEGGSLLMLRHGESGDLISVAFEAGMTVLGGEAGSIVEGLQDLEMEYVAEAAYAGATAFNFQPQSFALPTEMVIRRRTRGTVKSISQTELVAAIEGSGELSFRIGFEGALPTVEDYLLIDYSIDNRRLIAYAFEKLSVATLGLQSAAGTVTDDLGGGLLVELAPPSIDENGELDPGLMIELTYDKTVILGCPVEGEKASFSYFPSSHEELSADGAILTTAATDEADYLYGTASRIVCANHTHTYAYQPLGNNQHLKYCVDLDVQGVEECTNENGICPYCGQHVSASASPLPKTGDRLLW